MWKDQAPRSGIKQSGGGDRIVVPGPAHRDRAPGLYRAEGMGDMPEIKSRVLGVDDQPYETSCRHNFGRHRRGQIEPGADGCLALGKFVFDRVVHCVPFC